MNETTLSSQEGSKPWYQSAAIIGAVATGLISLAAVFNIQLGELESQLREALLAVGTIASTVLAIWGRIRATKKIG